MTDGMSCVSSSPWMTLASISDGVRKMTTSSLDTRRVHLHQNHRHVVVLVGGADERLDLAQDALAQVGGVEMAVLADQPAEPRVAEQIAVRVHRLGDAVGVERDHVAGMEVD